MNCICRISCLQALQPALNDMYEDISQLINNPSLMQTVNRLRKLDEFYFLENVQQDW